MIAPRNGKKRKTVKKIVKKTREENNDEPAEKPKRLGRPRVLGDTYRTDDDKFDHKKYYGERINCDCGCVVARSSMPSHIVSKKHKLLISIHDMYN